MSVDGSIDVNGFPYDIQKPRDTSVVHVKKKLKEKHLQHLVIKNCDKTLLKNIWRTF